MNVVLSLLGKLWPYLIAAAIAGYGVHKLDTASYNALQAKFSQYQAVVADDAVASQKAAAAALADQIAQRSEADANNAQVIAKMQSEKDNLSAGLVFSQRLLSALKASSGSGSGQVPPGSNGEPGASKAPTGGESQSLADLLGASAAECRHDIEQLNALQQELIPQLKGASK